MSETQNRPSFLTVKQVGRELQVSRATVYRKIQTGELEAVRLGEHGRLRIPPAAVGGLLRPAYDREEQ